MIIMARVKSEEQALEYVNDILIDLGREKTEDLEYSDDKISVTCDWHTRHTSEGAGNITMKDYSTVNIIVDDLDFETQEIINKHKNKLHRL